MKSTNRPLLLSYQYVGGQLGGMTKFEPLPAPKAVLHCTPSCPRFLFPDIFSDRARIISGFPKRSFLPKAATMSGGWNTSMQASPFSVSSFPPRLFAN